MIGELLVKLQPGLINKIEKNALQKIMEHISQNDLAPKLVH